MNRWTKLREGIHKELRDAPKREFANEIRRELQRLTKLDLCTPSAPNLVKEETLSTKGSAPKAAGRSKRIVLSSSAESRIGNHPALSLKNLHSLRDARLGMVITVGKNGHLQNYSFSVVGTHEDGSSWFVRIDLDDEQKGSGPCRHPLLHCHVGQHPDAESHQEVRTPLPWLEPHEALVWILATLDDRLEPIHEVAPSRH